MQLNVTARHLDLTPSLSQYVRRKVEKAQRYFDSIVWAQVILSVEKHRHIAEVIAHTPGKTFRIKETAGDLYSAIDLATHKMDIHLSRVKDKQRSHRPKNNPKGYAPEEVFFSENASRTDPSIVEFKKAFLSSQTPSQAIEGLNSNGMPFFAFINEQTNQMNIVYKKGRGGYGLLEMEP